MKNCKYMGKQCRYPRKLSLSAQVGTKGMRWSITFAEPLKASW